MDDGAPDAMSGEPPDAGHASMLTASAPAQVRGPLPDFVVIGAMKSGSTTLDRYLREHPQVYLSDPKELHFFVAERNWAKGEDWYRSQFAPGRSAVVRGEASVTYTQSGLHPGVPERMAATVPDARLIYLLRDPVERMRSHYVHELTALREDLPMEQAFRAHPRYLDASRYAAQLALFLQHYPREQVLVLSSEALWQRPEQTLADVFAFLDVDRTWRPSARVHVNSSMHKSVPRPIVHRLRSTAVARAAIQQIPVAMRDRIKEKLPRRPLDPAATAMAPELATELWAELRPDVDELRRMLGSDADRLGLESWGVRT